MPYYLLLGWIAATAAWWGVALVELPADAPDWVVRARYICFGTPRSGLPDPSGWVLLTASPLSFLVALWLIWGADLRQDLGRRWHQPRLRVGLAALAAIVAVGIGWAGHRIGTAAGRGEVAALADTAAPFPETYPRLDRPAAPFALVDQRGRPVSLNDLRGRLVFMTFAFAHCNAICPTTVQNVLRGARDAPEPNRVVVITLDPWRDTARSLPAIASTWGLDSAGGLALSGDVATVNAVLDAYGVVRQRDLGTGDITHPGLVYVLDRAGRIAYALNQPSPSWVREAGRRAEAIQRETSADGTSPTATRR